MSWKENLLAGSFRDVPFLTEASEAEVGRRTALHEYPLRDKPYAEDMGRKARRFTLDIYVLGKEYMAGRDALINAFEKAGPGILVHPYLGEMTVTVIEARGPRESTREGGMARFSVTFVEAGEALFPRTKADTVADVQDGADDTMLDTESEFAGSFDVTGPEYLFEDAKTLIGFATDQLDALQKMLPGVPETVTAYVAKLTSFAARTEALIREPADLAMEIYGLISDLALLPDRPIRAFNAYRQLWDALTGEREIAQTTAGRTQQAANQAAVQRLVQRAAIVEAVRTSAAIEFESYDDAIAVRDELADKLDGEMETAGDEVYAALADLRVAMVKDISVRGVDLARISQYVPAATLPALVIAYYLYDNPERAEEIIARNHIRHPGFVPGGVALEVLTDA
jgi:prophage DNA circulation protein